MVAEPVINVEVTVAEELRRLLAFGAGGVWCSDHAPSPAVSPQEPAPSAPVSLDWPQIVLRRDGQRPLVFRGLPVMIRRCTPDTVVGAGDQTLAFYMAEDRTIYASLTFEPPETAPARPTYHCQKIRSQSDLASFVQGWFPEMSSGAGVAPNSQQHLSAGKSAVRSALNFFAADCLSKGALQVQGNPLCHP